MALAFLNNCRWAPSLYASGNDFTVDAAAAGGYVPADCVAPVVVNGATYHYFAVSADGTQHEEGDAPFTTGTMTLERQAGTVRNGSAGPGTFVNFSAAPTVYMGGPIASDLSPTQPIINITGTWAGPQVWTSVPRYGITLNSTFISPAGAWLESIFLEAQPSITAIDFTNVVGIASEFSAGYNSGDLGLTSISMPMLEVSIGSMTFQEDLSTTLTDIDFSSLSYVGSSLSIRGTGLTDVEFPVLEIMLSGFTLESATQVTSFSAPVLVFTYGIYTYACNVMTDFLFPELVNCNDSFTISQASSLTNIDFSVLENVGVSGGNGDFLAENLDVITTLGFPALESVFGGFTLNNLPLLTSYDFSALGTIGGVLQAQEMPLITNFELPALTSVGGINVQNYLEMETFSLPALTVCEDSGVQLYNCTNLQEINMPSLVSVDNFSPIQLTTLPALTTIDFSSLESTGNYIGFYGLDALTTVTFPALKDVSNPGDAGQLSAISCGALTSYSVPALETVQLAGGISISFEDGTDSLTTFNIGTSLKQMAGDVSFTSCALDQTSVDNLLVALAALDGSGSTTSYDNHTVTIMGGAATPSGAGLAAKTVLEGRGNTVNVN